MFSLLSKWIARPVACSSGVNSGVLKTDRYRTLWTNAWSINAPSTTNFLGWAGATSIFQPLVGQQVRWITRRTRRRKLMARKKKDDRRRRAKGIIHRPAFFLSKKAPIVNGVSRKDQQAISQRLDEEAAQELQEKIKQTDREILTYHMSQTSPTFNLTMSDRVRKVFALGLGNQQQVVQAQKQRGMELFQLREGDTGSSAVQIVALTTRIQQLQVHMNGHKKDYSCKRGLEALLVRRRKMLDYMERREKDQYRKVVKTLGLYRK